jgi:methylase of polypeptide subunit release factors
LLLEVGRGQADQVAARLGEVGSFEQVAAHKDLAGIERVVAARLRA